MVRAGYAIDDEEKEEGPSAASSAAVRGHFGEKLFAAISVSGPAFPHDQGTNSGDRPGS